MRRREPTHSPGIPWPPRGPGVLLSCWRRRHPGLIRPRTSRTAGTPNRYLELALAARDAVIVSGDEDLLVLNPWRGLRVLRPARLLRGLEPDGRQVR
jgi:hypothetical protein